MSVFFDYKVGTSSTSIHTDIKWHPKYPVLAVATKNDGENEPIGVVSICYEEVIYI